MQRLITRSCQTLSSLFVVAKCLWESFLQYDKAKTTKTLNLNEPTNYKISNNHRKKTSCSYLICVLYLFFSPYVFVPWRCVYRSKLLVLFVYLCSILSTCVRLQSPPASAKVPKSVSDRKRFFENAMEDHNKPAKSGMFNVLLLLISIFLALFVVFVARIKNHLTFLYVNNSVRNSVSLNKQSNFFYEIEKSRKYNLI